MREALAEIVVAEAHPKNVVSIDGLLFRRDLLLGTNEIGRRQMRHLVLKRPRGLACFFKLLEPLAPFAKTHFSGPTEQQRRELQHLPGPDEVRRAAVVIKPVSADSLRKMGIFADKGGDFRRFPPQVRRTGSPETRSNARKAGISGPFLRFLRSLAERTNGWLATQC